MLEVITMCKIGVSQMMKLTQVADEASCAAEQATHAATPITLGEKIVMPHFYLLYAEMLHVGFLSCGLYS